MNDMKSVLGVLLCLVLFQAECYAHKGGPDYGTGQITTTGIYAGLFVPSNPDGSDNSLGIFSANIPRNGIGSGTVAFFRKGIFYPGTLQGLADPDTGVLTAVVSSSFNITFTSETA